MESEKGFKSMDQAAINRAIMEIDGILSQIMVTGAVDSEPDYIKLLKARLLRRDISPEDAIKEAWELSNSRGNYH